MGVRAMNWAHECMSGSRLTASERLVLMVLAHHHHENTNACFPAIATIADLVGLSTRRVQITLRSLAAKGLITIAVRTVHGRQRSNQYDLFGVLRGDAAVTPKSRLRGDKKSTPQTSRGATLASPDREYSTDRGDQTAPDVIPFPRKTARG